MISDEVFSQKDLDHMTCSAPGCDHTSHDSTMFFHSRCHPLANMEVSYEKGVLMIRCGDCGRRVAFIKVAEG